MKQTVEKRKLSGIVDYLALAFTTWGVGYGPIAPGTWGSAVGVAIYIGTSWIFRLADGVFLGAGPQGVKLFWASTTVIVAVLLTAFCIAGIWASGRSIPLLGSSDPSEAVVDEIMGQLITFCFIPFGLSWPFLVAGFLLFRLFDIWKPYPIRTLEILPGGLGICADDIVAGVYAGICLAVGYAAVVIIGL